MINSSAIFLKKEIKKQGPDSQLIQWFNTHVPGQVKRVQTI